MKRTVLILTLIAAAAAVITIIACGKTGGEAAGGNVTFYGAGS